MWTDTFLHMCLLFCTTKYRINLSRITQNLSLISYPGFVKQGPGPLYETVAQQNEMTFKWKQS